jgi:general secretion pathway protein K
MTGRAPRRERGFAMLAAIIAVSYFGYLALTAIEAGRSTVAAASAGLAREKLSADADAGVTVAVHELGLTDPTQRWAVTGPAHVIDFGGAKLVITVEDEGGKIPINFVQAPDLTQLFEQAGADPRAVDNMVEALQALRGDPTPGGFPDFGPRIAAERGPLTSLDELNLLPGMTPALYAKIAPAVTVYGNTLAFDPQTAPPLAVSVMSASTALQQTLTPTPPSATGGHSAGKPPPAALSGRTVTIRVEADDHHGGRIRRTAVVEFTSAPARPYVVRALE